MNELQIYVSVLILNTEHCSDKGNNLTYYLSVPTQLGVPMTLLELINKEIGITPNTKLLKSLNITALIEAKTILKKVLNEELIDEWIKDGLLDYSRRSKNRLTDILNILEVSEIDSVVLIHRFEEQKCKTKLKNSDHNINAKREVIKTTALDGTELIGVLVWSAKDYTVQMLEPFELECGGYHLMYAIPTVYVLSDTKKDGVKCLPLLERAKKALILKYEKEKSC